MKHRHHIFHKNILYISAILFILASVVFVTQVLAVGRPNSPTGYGVPPQGNTPTGTSGGVRPSIPTNPGSGYLPQRTQSGGVSSQGQSRMPVFTQVHLQDAKLRACQAISASLVTRSTHLVDLVNQMEKTFTSIAQGVEQYYLTSVLPTGTTLSNYNTMVADIATEQNALTSLIQAALTDVSSFSCTGNNPAAQLTQYRTDMQAVLKGLQDYRTAIKNLIVAVRTLPSVKSSETPSITPTGTPSVTPLPTVTP